MRPSHTSGDPHWLIPDGTAMGLKKGEEISVEALMHGLMMVSGNDAANTLAEAHSGSIPKFVEEVNSYLRNVVGCTATQFCNPHGIHSDEHFTSAYDLCLIAKRGLQIPKFREIVSKVVYTCPKTNKQPEREMKQSNALLRKGAHYYPKAIGVKTGYFSTAMNNLIAAAEHEGRTLIAVLLGCPKSADRYKDAKLLFETAFKEKMEKTRLMGPERVFNREVPGATHALQATLTKDLEIAYFPSEEPVCKAFVQWDIPPLPIKKGQKVGEVLILDEQGKTIQAGDLLAKTEVKGSFFFMLKKKLF
jgi:D-alanyl-D-alanine carboxypeptidase (penicillin-binding protein 5/6)